MIGPVSFKVRWDKPKTQAVVEPDAEDTTTPFDLLPGLVNMQKMAQKIRVTKGK
jgi:hypothetical protein